MRERKSKYTYFKTTLTAKKISNKLKVAPYFSFFIVENLKYKVHYIFSKPYIYAPCLIVCQVYFLATGMTISLSLVLI